MPDAFARIKQGEKRPVFGQATAQTGATLAIQSGATYTLYDALGNVVAGHGAGPVTGYESGDLAAPRVWLALDTTTPESLAPGFYVVVFTLSALGSDGIMRVFAPTVEVQVMDARA